MLPVRSGARESRIAREGSVDDPLFWMHRTLLLSGFRFLSKVAP